MYHAARRIRVLVTGVATLLLGGVGAQGLTAQAQPATAADSLRAEVARLMAVVDSLRARVDELQSQGQKEEAQDALSALRAAAQAAAAASGQAAPPPPQAEQQQEFVGRQRSLQALNPEISLTGDLLAQVVKGDTHSDNFFPREFELSVVSNLDPYSRAKAFISRHEPGGEIEPFGGGGGEGGGELAVEEGYVEWVSLPGGFGLKLGHFYQQFGQLNRWHSHAYPFQSRSLPSIAFLGEEPLGQTGASARWLLPVGGGAGTYTVTGEVTRSENENLFGTSTRPSTLANFNGFWVLSPAVDVDASVSWVNGSYEDSTNLFNRNLYGAEVSFTWRPPARSLYRGLNIRAGVMVLDGLIAEDGTHLAKRAKGIYTMFENRLSQRWLVGGRFDWTENPQAPDQTAWLVSPTLTWWQSEFVRIRGEYDLLGRDNTRPGRFMLQVTFAMGPHKHENY